MPSIDSDLVELQPYFLVVMVTTASSFSAWMQLRDKRCCWRFEKTFVLQKKLSFWPSEVALTFIPAVKLYAPYRVGVQAQANFSAPTFEPAHEARAGKRAALSVNLRQDPLI